MYVKNLMCIAFIVINDEYTLTQLFIDKVKEERVEDFPRGPVVKT